MGEVYRAKDTRLDRTVAVKILAEHLADNAELRQRFEHEARAASSLNHPHICALYDIGSQNGIDFLVMEYLDGETLAVRLAKGPPLTLQQALLYGIQIAAALDKAHRQGLCHRDLKPGNIMLTKAGAKLLDFGLAKCMDAPAGPAQHQTSEITQGAVQTPRGIVLGTYQYMAPEQLEGKDAVPHSDIFSFGSVLYEMLTGQRAFQGPNQTSVIKAILTSDPPPVSSLQPAAPPALDRLVSTCLAKDPEERWQTAYDLMLQLKWIAEGVSSAVAPVPGTSSSMRPICHVAPARSRRRWIGMTAALLLPAVLALAIFYLRSPAPETRSIAFSVPPPEKSAFTSISVSPDGRRLAFTASSAGGKSLLWVRALDAIAPHPLPDTEGAYGPFWSPDSRWIAFFAGGKLKKIDPSGGRAQTLCSIETNIGAGGTWNREDVILFTPNFQSPLFRVSAKGGAPLQVTAFDRGRRESSHRWPDFLPDGRHFLYLALSYQNNAIYAGSLDSHQVKRVLGTSSRAMYAPPGYLLFVREETLMRQPFDPRRLELEGEPIPVAEPVGAGFGQVGYAVSESGVLAYGAGAARDRQLAWFDREGKKSSVVGTPGRYNDVSLSPDEKRVAVTLYDERTDNGDVWLIETSRSAATRLTFHASLDYCPVWSPSGNRIVFASLRDGPVNLYEKASQSGGEDTLLLGGPTAKYPHSWSPDGRFLVYSAADENSSSRNLWALAPSGDRKAVRLTAGPFEKSQAQISPDGRWMAYISNETGNWEVYIQPFSPEGARPGKNAPPGGRWQISTGGGVQPRWARNGKELFYFAPDRKLMAVEVKTVPEFEASRPKPLFEANSFAPVATVVYRYAVSADGQRFLINSPVDEANISPITVIVNWTAALRR